MKRILKIGLVGALMAAALVAQAEASQACCRRKVMIFVAPNGDDAAEGTFKAPVKTLARAVEIAAEPLRRESVRTIYLRGGEYSVTQTVRLGPEMSGTIVRAYGDERPVLTGATRVRGFGPVTDAAMKARFPEAVREKVCETDVKAQGYSGFEPHAPSGLFYSSAIQKTEPVRRANTLYCGGRRLMPARSPNEGFVRIAEVLDATGHVFRASVPEMAKLGRADAPDLVTCGYYQYFWDDENVSAEVTDPSRGVVKIDWLDGREVKQDQTLFFQNAPALLDRPGEWYLDRVSGKLYVLPPEDADGEYVLAGFAGPFLRLDGCHEVSVMGLVFEYGRGDAVVIANAERVAFTGNVVRNFGGIGLQATGRDLRIVGNVLRGFGFDAMRVTGGNRETLEPSGIVVEGNDVSDSGFVQRCYTPGILLNGCGTKIVRNRFHDIPSSAMRVEGNDYDIVSNLIERVVTESDDQGGSDSYGNASYAGTVYRYNVWTDIVPEGVAPCGRAGIRFDDAISNQKVYGNRFHNCSVGHFGGVQIHGGRCNLVSNNLFTACKYGVSFTPWTAERWHAQLDRYRIERGVRLDLPAYVRRYPGIERLYDMPMTNTVCCNVMVGVEKDVYSSKLPAETAVWGNGVFKAMPGAEELKAVAGFEMPPTAEEVGPRPDEPNLKRARRNDAVVGSVGERMPLIVNEPAEHFFVMCSKPRLAAMDGKPSAFTNLLEFRFPSDITCTEQGAERYVDALVGGNTTHLFVNVNYQRSFYPSQVIEPIWTSLDEPDRTKSKFIRNLRDAFDRGFDVYAVMTRRSRERGVSPWLSFRMNDIHGSQSKSDPMASTFWREHPELHLSKETGWENGLDYAAKSVRDRMSAYIREAVARYDVDGVELDLIRFPFYFREGTEAENAPLLTEFVREIRGICTAEAGRRGHPVKVAVRLLPDPQRAVKMGADVGTWAREGLVDMVIVCNMFGSIEYEYRLGDWRKLLGDRALLVAGTDNGIIENGKRRILNLDEYRHWIDLMRRDGADGIYFFNFPLRPFRDETWRGILGDHVTVNKPSYTTLIAHRGESVDAPENTLPAYRTAVERGFGFECDIYLSKDKQLYTFHDRTLTRTTSGANTNSCTDVDWETVSKLNVGGWGKWKGSKFDPTRPVRFSEVLALARDGRTIYVEVKLNDPSWVPYVKAEVEKAKNVNPGNVLFITFGDKVCAELKRQLPEYRVYYLMGASRKWGDYANAWTAEEIIGKLRAIGADGVDIFFVPEVHDAAFVKKIHDAGFSFHVWTIDDLAKAKKAFAVGADTLTTNCAKKILEAAATENRTLR